MSGLLDYMQLCRLCLVKEKVNVPIFGDGNDVRQIFLKITACLPVKVSGVPRHIYILKKTIIIDSKISQYYFAFYFTGF